MLRPLASLAAAALVATGLLAPPAAHGQNPQFIAKPGSADPAIAFFNGTYFLTSTRSNLIRTSVDLRTWRNSDVPLFAPGKGPRWGVDDKVSGPEIYYLPAIGQYALLFNMVHGVKGKHCIGRAVSATPDNFVNEGRESYKAGVPPRDGPLECEGGQGDLSPSDYSLIDQSLFQDPRDGSYYLLYKRDYPDQRTKDIVIRSIGPDAKSGLGAPTQILSAPAPGTWEGDSVEAPTMIYRNGRYFVFYSGANFARDSYAVGVAASLNQAAGQNRPNGTFKKYDGNPILKGAGDDKFCGVGSQDVVNVRADEWQIFYHAYLGPQTGDCAGDTRYLMSDVLRWDRPGGTPRRADFWPSVNDGTPSGDGTPAGVLQNAAPGPPPGPPPSGAVVRARSAKLVGGRSLRVALRSSVPGSVAIAVRRSGRTVAQGGKRVATTAGSVAVRTRLTRSLGPGRYTVRLTTYDAGGKRVGTSSVGLRVRQGR